MTGQYVRGCCPIALRWLSMCVSLLVTMSLLRCGTAEITHASDASAREGLSAPTVSPNQPRVVPSQPQDRDLYTVDWFPEPLVPLGGESTDDERRELGRIGNAWEATNHANTSDFERFLVDHPHTVWRASLWTNLGLVYRYTGRYGRALAAWESAWEAARQDTTAAGIAIGDRAVSELAELSARLGRMDRLHALFRELRGRPVHGSQVNHLQDAWEGLSMMHTHPEIAFLCGPLALGRVVATRGGDALAPEIRAMASTTRGTNLTQVWQLSQRIGAGMQMAWRAPGAPVIAPVVVNWKVGHFAALTHSIDDARLGARHRLEDPTFEDDVWITTESLDEEASGYMLVPDGPLPAGWRKVSPEEGNSVWGKGYTSTSHRGYYGLADLLTDACRASQGMARYGLHTMLASLHVQDTPVWINAPYGPQVAFTAVYNQADFTQSALPRMSGLGPKWSFNYRQFIEEVDVVATGAVPQRYKLYLGSGGVQDYSFTDDSSVVTQTSTRELRDRSQLRRDIGTVVPRPLATNYRHILTDGSIEEYDHYLGIGAHSGRMFALTRVLDPQGNAATIQYDANHRITRITDAVGQSLTLSYGASTDPASAAFYRVTQVLTSTGIVANFNYTGERLTSIQDQAGMVSSFAYRAEMRGIDHPISPDDSVGAPPEPDPDFLYQMVTPYGTTSFSTGWIQDPYNSTSSSGYPYAYNRRWVDVTNPEGEHERVEYRHFWPTESCEHTSCGATPSLIPRDDLAPAYLQMMYAPSGGFLNNLEVRNSLYWDSRSWSRSHDSMGNENPGAWRYAKLYHWLHRAGTIDQATGVLESEKEPEHNRIWYHYPNQTSPQYLAIGSLGLPDVVTEIVGVPPSSGIPASRTTSFTWSDAGRPLTRQDERGRTTTMTYLNDTDLSDVRLGGSVYVGQFQSYVQHQPTRIIDAAGQTTTIAYNCVGQPLSVSRPDGVVTSFTYESSGGVGCTGTVGRLVSISGPGGTSTVSLYNARNLPVTVTDAAGIVRTFHYDALDRITQIDYPDGTSNQVSYGQLDANGNPRLSSGGTPLPGLEATVGYDREGHQTLRAYDRVHRLILHRDALGNNTRYSYCCGNGVQQVTDARGNVTSFDRDLARYDNRPTAMYRADGTYVRYEYDLNGRLLAETDGLRSVGPPGAGVRAVYTYNNDDTVDAVRVTLGGQVYGRTYVYDPTFLRVNSVGREVPVGGGTMSVADAYFAWRPYGSLGGGQIASVTGTLPDSTITYTYDTLGRRTGRTLNGTQWNVRYDTHDRVSHVDRTSAGVTRTFDYNYLPGDSQAFLDHVDFPVVTGVTGRGRTTFGYYGTDQVRRLNGFAHYDVENKLIDNGGFVYSGVGRIQWRQKGSDWDYWGYDNGGQVLFNNHYTPNSGGGWNVTTPVSYHYDTQVNRDQVTAAYPGYGSVTWTTSHDSADRMTSRVDSSGYNVTLTSDDRGNVTYDGFFNYTWDAFNRLQSANVWGTTTAFAYDGFGRLASWSESGTTHYFVWDGLELVQERDSTTHVLREIFPEGFSQGGHRYDYVRDERGSVLGLLDETGYLVKKYSYDNWGVRGIVYEAAGMSGIDAPIGFTGMMIHPRSGLYLTQARVYNPNIARWLGRDPAGQRPTLDGRNLYAFAANDPVNNSDTGGQYLDTALDLGFIAYDAYNIYQDFEGGRCGNVAGHVNDLALDVLGALIPGVTGLSVLAATGRRAESVAGHAVINANRSRMHFSIEVHYGGRSTHTHFDWVPGSSTHGEVRELSRIERLGMGGGDRSVRFDLPNAAAAQARQAELLAQAPSEWAFLQNCCATHVTDVLARGGGPFIDARATGGWENFWAAVVAAGGR